MINLLIFLGIISLMALVVYLSKKKPVRPKIWIDVCNDFPDMPPDQARIAGEFCPSQHPAQYLVAAQPTTPCGKHLAPPPPPLVKKVKNPYHKTKRVISWAPDLMCTVIQQDNELWHEADLPKLLDAMVEDGVPTLRAFAATMDGNPNVWDFTMPWNGYDIKTVNPDYVSQVERRMRLIQERDLTAIICLTPYGLKSRSDLDKELGPGLGVSQDVLWSPDFPVYIRNLVRLYKKFLPNVIFETINEPDNGWGRLQEQIVDICLEEGVGPELIQIEFFDSGDCARILVDKLQGKGLCSLHWTGSMNAIEAPWPKGWTDSEGSMRFMQVGLYPNNDGGDGFGKGLLWSWLPKGEGRRSSPQQIFDVTKWSLKHWNKFTKQDEFGRGFEHLSASGFQKSGRPDLLQEIELGRPERQALVAAYQEVLGE